MNRSLFIVSLFLLVLLLTAVPAAFGSTSGRAETDIRIGISEAVFEGLNTNDTSAALRAWATDLARERNVDVNAQMMVYSDFTKMRQDFMNNELDGANLNPWEFEELGQHTEFVYLASSEESEFVRYGVIVNTGSGIENLNQLLGLTVVTNTGPHMTVIEPWLQTVFAQENGGKVSRGLDQLLENTTKVSDSSKAIFQVFFGQADAAFVTLDAFDTACILNPQLQKNLQVVYLSPPLIEQVFIFNPAFQGAMRKRLEEVVADMDASVKGKQVLTLFRCSRLVKAPASILDSTRALFVQYQQLLKQHNIRGE